MRRKRRVVGAEREADAMAMIQGVRIEREREKGDVETEMTRRGRESQRLPPRRKRRTLRTREERL